MADHVILMTSYPLVGESKARFITALGSRGAARLHRTLSEHTAQVARTWREGEHDRLVFVACEGATIGEFRDWLGDDLEYETQSGGSLGARLAVASVRALSRGADRVILCLGDCPDLDKAHLARAFYALDHTDCVVGPNHTGGYHLIGLVAPTPALFAGVPWGTGAVLVRTLDIARRESLRLGLLPPLPVIGGPRDLIHAATLIGSHPLSDSVS
jgi:uncharacterized protein